MKPITKRTKMSYRQARAYIVASIGHLMSIPMKEVDPEFRLSRLLDVFIDNVPMNVKTREDLHSDTQIAIDIINTAINLHNSKSIRELPYARIESLQGHQCSNN